MRFSRLFASLVFMFLVAVALLSPAQSAEFKHFKIPSAYGGTISVIRLDGDINLTDHHEFQRILRKHPDAEEVFLNSPGGAVDPAFEIGRIIKKRQMTTVAGTFCTSACGLIWLSGSELSAVSGARIGFHAAFQGDGDVTSVGNARVGAYVSELGYGNNVVEYVTEAQPKDMKYLDYRDAKLLGLKVTIVERQFTATVEAPANPSSSEPGNDEGRFWQFIFNSNNIRLFQTYLELYPYGKHAEEAKLKISQLQGEESGPKRWFFAGYRDVDFWGGDIHTKGIEAATVDDCIVACGQDTTCRLFTYNQRQKRCFPKNAIDLVVKSPGALSGLVFDTDLPVGEEPPPPLVVAEFRSFPGRSYTGPVLPFWQPDSRIRTIDGCLRHCRERSDCSYVTFNRAKRGKFACTVRRYLTLGTSRSRRATSFEKIKENVFPSMPIVELDVSR